MPLTLQKPELIIIGWREWIGLPKLKVKKIKVKIDTGARTSALHVSDISIHYKNDVPYVHFTIHPIQHQSSPTIHAKAKLIEYRRVKSSSGHISTRPVIHTKFLLGEMKWEGEVTLVDRDLMGFRMLLGRQAVRNRFLVHPGRSYRHKKKKKVEQ